ncbi:unnamed protein product [Paramecium pentaurelia]|uniref:Uncharacterized protein n=1 Tax=Paramecium pentaurelia TaxID=43138 RepID=A0A8S1VEQ9_9CILI|nr:unnamed protein product [Paramecium pentaurelia]
MKLICLYLHSQPQLQSIQQYRCYHLRYFNIIFFKIFNLQNKCLSYSVICNIELVKNLRFSLKPFFEEVIRTFSAEGYLKFKSYASKFQGSLATSVFETFQTNPNDIQSIKHQPFSEAEEILKKF